MIPKLEGISTLPLMKTIAITRSTKCLPF